LQPATKSAPSLLDANDFTLFSSLAPSLRRQQKGLREHSMADVVFVLITVLFFWLAWFYARGLDRL